MTFDAREARAKAVEIYRPFDFIGLDGEAYELPHVKMVDPGLTKALQSDDPDERDQGMDQLAPAAWAAIQAMEPAVQVMLVEAWQEHSGLSDDEDDPGKGQEQSSGPNRAARRSKRTSPSGASTSTRSRSGKSKAASGSS